MKRAFEGTDFAQLDDVLEGPSAIAVAKEDATAPARVLNEAIKEFKKMEFKGGFVEGEYYDKDGITHFASMRGVYDKDGKGFKCDVAGNDKRYGFFVHR